MKKIQFLMKNPVFDEKNRVFDEKIEFFMKIIEFNSRSNNYAIIYLYLARFPLFFPHNIYIYKCDVNYHLNYILVCR